VAHRLAVAFTPFGTGRAVINTWGEIGYDIANETEFRIALGELFEVVSATASGALTATEIEIAGITFGSALQRQASQTRIEGQAQAEIA
jgi:hypothetical protein